MIRKAVLHDWVLLERFYSSIYKPHHPLLNIDFWKWQFGNEKFGCAYIVEIENSIIAHLGVAFIEGFSWVINLYVKPEYRATRWLLKLYDAVRSHGLPLVTTNANQSALSMYRKLEWIRYSNLERFVLIKDNKKSILENLSPVSVICPDFLVQENLHYWKQPGLTPVLLSDGSTGINQSVNGGFRFVTLNNIKSATDELWEMGFKWCDYITSWNDLIIDKVIRNNWVSTSENFFPFFLSPLDMKREGNISFLSEKKLDKMIIVRRYHSDHGRIGSL